MNNKIIKIVLIILGVFLVFNGIINVLDDKMLLSYDITSILSGIGFLLISFKKIK